MSFESYCLAISYTHVLKTVVQRASRYIYLLYACIRNNMSIGSASGTCTTDR